MSLSGDARAPAHCLFQYVEGHRAKREHFVELLDVEGGTLALLGLLTQVIPDGMADFVAARLARPHRISINLALASSARDASRSDQEIRRFFAAPTLGVHP